MSVTTITSSMARPAADIKPEGLWLRNRNWDTIFMTLSVLLVPMPYLFYLLGMRFGLAETVARNGVNLVVAFLVGGPHMYATFMRTALDEQFVKRYPALIRSSILIPIIVVSLAFLDLTLLLTIFFFWASIHVLHQVTYIVELYNHRKKSAVTIWARVIDYALVLTCLFPVAAYKISQNDFNIGTNDLTAVIPGFFKADWFWWSATAVFATAVVAFAIKTFLEWRGGYIHWPKTVFIVITVAVAFTMPALKNLDTAFQGLNTWHSLQYLALTIYIVRLRKQRGDLEKSSKLVDRMAGGDNSLRLYLFTLSMVVGSLVLGVAVYLTVGIVDPGRDPQSRFDTAYYTAILCFLWIHYYHDHFLFTDFEAVDRAAGLAPKAATAPAR
ncbi:MAG: hypothetical protein ACYDBJ_17475 [Aggregatilineales bacterium]